MINLRLVTILHVVFADTRRRESEAGWGTIGTMDWRERLLLPEHHGRLTRPTGQRNWKRTCSRNHQKSRQRRNEGTYSTRTDTIFAYDKTDLALVLPWIKQRCSKHENLREHGLPFRETNGLWRRWRCLQIVLYGQRSKDAFLIQGDIRNGHGWIWICTRTHQQHRHLTSPWRLHEPVFRISRSSYIEQDSIRLSKDVFFYQRPWSSFVQPWVAKWAFSLKSANICIHETSPSVQYGIANTISHHISHSEPLKYTTKKINGFAKK